VPGFLFSSLKISPIPIKFNTMAKEIISRVENLKIWRRGGSFLARRQEVPGQGKADSHKASPDPDSAES
jgi:hypothetical protein